MEKKQANNLVISNQVALVNQKDKYLDIDQKIFDNYNKAVKDKSWGRQGRSVAKLPPKVLFFGMNRSESLGTAPTDYHRKRTSEGVAGIKIHSKPPKSKQSHRVRAGTNTGGTGLGFTAVDISSMGIDQVMNTAFSVNFK